MKNVIFAKLSNKHNKIIIKKGKKQIKKIDIKDINIGIIYDSYINVEKENDKNKKILLHKIEENDYILVYSDEKKVWYYRDTLEKVYKRMLILPYKVFKIALTKQKVYIDLMAYIINKYQLKLGKQKLYVDEKCFCECEFKKYNDYIPKIKMLSCMKRFSYDINKILEDDSLINSNIRFVIEIEGKQIEYKIGFKKNIKNKRYYYSPIKSICIDDYAIHFRRTLSGNLVLVKRKKEDIENTNKFKILENKFISKLFYYIGKILKKFRKKHINLFYEKFSEKAEEGTFDLFIKIRDNSESKSYFIIDKKSNDYEKIKNEKNIVKKYSFKYYWLIYNANNFISTEAPIHLNILRSNNKYLRRALMDGKFIFLQHGITYLKCQGTGSTFSKNKEGEASYIIVGSNKEKEAVEKMLKLDESQIIKAGLPIFDKVHYKHINNDTEDILTIMLTWKPYEEQLYNFEESTYYKNTIEIYNLLRKYTDKEKIKIVAHPKVYELLNSTDIKNNIWHGKISEVLEQSKLLITDYSSVCYNSFYQGAGVIFYQPDLEKYEIENGKLVPNDDEYIGYRAFSLQQLEKLLQKTINDGKIDLNYIRNKEFEKRYKTINEFSDGKNIDRIYQELERLNII